MSGKSKFIPPKQHAQPKPPPGPEMVDSLLARMEDGNEFGSIVSLMPKDGNVVPELRKGLAEIERARGRPCVCYVANTLHPMPGTSIESSDDLPFNEMIARVSAGSNSVDVLLVTPGGSGQQVSQFVNTLRPRFGSVEYLLPYMCMSAGTLWALSGDKIWMDRRAFIGPIDPQVRLPDGQFIPAQSLLTLLDKIQKEGEEALKKGSQPSWSNIRLLDNIDGRHIGNAITMSNYSIKLASSFLAQYKFKGWTKRDPSGEAVTEEYRKEKADKVATKLCSNDYWKSHAHGISRDVADAELRIQIDKVETDPAFERALRRFWALLYWTFDKGTVSKMFLSQNYVVVRNVQIVKG
jgi:hypothetical protein